jgi:hypothetical protein
VQTGIQSDGRKPATCRRFNTSDADREAGC